MAAPNTSTASSGARELVREVLAETPIIDGHNDLPMALRDKTGYSVAGLDRVRDEFHTDLVRLRQGGVGAQFWSVYVASSLPEPEAVVSTLEQIDAVKRMIGEYPDALAAAYTADDVEAAWRSGRIASLLGIEGGHSIANSLGVLRDMARLGVRYMTLTHNDNTEWADSATDQPGVGGLSDEGRAIVAEMNRIGMLVDISHTAATTQLDALKASTAPVIYSHSSCRAVADHPRNANDEALEALSRNGGVIQITFVPVFVSKPLAEWFDESMAARERFGLPGFSWTWPRAPRPGESADAVVAEFAAARASEGSSADGSSTEASSAEFEAWLAENPKPVVTVRDVADHVEHARDVAGIDHVGLGGDYDGVDALPQGLEDVASYPNLLTELAERGWSRDDLAKLTGRNVLRVMRDAEDAASDPLWPSAV